VQNETETELLVQSLENGPEDLLQRSKVNVFEDNLTPEEKNKIDEKAKEFLEFVVGKDTGEIRTILEDIVIDDISTLESSSELLSAKISHLDLIQDSSSSDIANTLVKLNTEIADINPHRFNFNINKFIAKLPFVGKPINKYLRKFKSASSVIAEIMEHLDEGAQLLRDDNTVLQHDKKRYKEAAVSLQRKAMVLEQVVNAIEHNLANFSEDERIFYENNLLFSLNKKIRSIYEILIVTQEGFLSSDLISNTNWELIDNISNVRTVTKRALEIGVSMLVALENQKNVIDAVNKTKTVTNDLIVGNAKRMNQQAAEIYKQSGDSTLQIEALKEAFTHIDEAISKVNTFKAEAAGMIKNEISTLKSITNQLEERVKESEHIESYKLDLSIAI